ncbi:hypothetical protein QOZ80_9BG0716390 [Eleusine coracana subsp. coracana]|nr:hypothetical protein QOZ80_9BG0716390 [Eleusine coracana subsp. coracana]
MPPPEKPVPRPKPKPKPKPPKPKKLETGPAAAEAKPMPAPRWLPPEPKRDATGAAINGVPVLQKPFSCATYRLCPPPPTPSAATVHLRSGRLPTPLIAVSASLLALSAALLLALLVRWLVRRRRRLQQQQQQQDQEAPLAQEDDDEDSVFGVDTAAWGHLQEDGEGEEVESGDGGGVHHVWYIRTKGLDERAIAAIAAVVYDAAKMKKQQQPGGAGDGDEESGAGCAVCLAEFRDGETLRLLPRCGHAFHRGCIDTWLRAHVNCPLCRAPVQVDKKAADKARAATAAWVHGQAADANNRGAEEEAAERGGVVAPEERAVRRAASMVTVPRRARPDVAAVQAASSSAREEDMTGLAKIRRLLKLSPRSASFGAGSCQGLPTTRSNVNGDDDIE